MRRLICFLLGVLVLLPISPVNADDPPLQVFVSIEPLRSLVARVGGERVDVTVVVQGSQRPETYDPSPRQIAALTAAQVFFGVGLPLEAEWRRQLRVTGPRSPRWVDLSQELPRGDAHADAREPSTASRAGQEHGHDHGEIDPHVWLDPVYARHMALVIRDVLVGLDSGGADDYRRNADDLRGMLAALDRRIAGMLNASAVETFLVFHPAWGHFAARYGLEQLAIESGGKEPGPRAMTEVIRRARQAGVRTVFVDPRNSRRLAETVAQAIGAGIEVLDPLADDYPDNLLSAARAIAASGGSGQ